MLTVSCLLLATILWDVTWVPPVGLWLKSWQDSSSFPIKMPFYTLVSHDWKKWVLFSPSFTHLAAQAQPQFHGWRVCSQWAWIWPQSWVHWRCQNNICTLVQYWWSWRSVPSLPESPAEAVSVYCPCTARAPKCLSLESPQLCWVWRETGWWHRSPSDGCPGCRCGGCPLSQPNRPSTVCLSVVCGEVAAESAQPMSLQRLRTEKQQRHRSQARKTRRWWRVMGWKEKKKKKEKKRGLHFMKKHDNKGKKQRINEEKGQQIMVCVSLP